MSEKTEKSMGKEGKREICLPQIKKKTVHKAADNNYYVMLI